MVFHRRWLFTLTMWFFFLEGFFSCLRLVSPRKKRKKCSFSTFIQFICVQYLPLVPPLGSHKFLRSFRSGSCPVDYSRVGIGPPLFRCFFLLSSVTKSGVTGLTVFRPKSVNWYWRTRSRAIWTRDPLIILRGCYYYFLLSSLWKVLACFPYWYSLYHPTSVVWIFIEQTRPCSLYWNSKQVERLVFYIQTFSWRFPPDLPDSFVSCPVRRILFFNSKMNSLLQEKMR